MTTTITLTLINARPDDIPFDLAERAHHNISQHPEARARYCQNEYMAEMASLEAEFAPFVADSPGLTEELKIELEEYRQGYIKHQLAILHARSRTASSMITGPSNFPTARNEKRLATEQRRVEEYTTWRSRFYARLHKEFNPQAPRAISSDRNDAVDALRAKLEQAEQLQAKMVAANKIVRGKGDDAAKLQRLMSECGMGRTEAGAVLMPDSWGQRGYADYQIKNNGAEIRRLRQRMEVVQAQQSRPERRADFDGGYMLDNPENNRVQIFFDQKPAHELIAKLRANGFRWASSEGAWQRQRTNAGIYAAETLMGVKF